MPPKEAGGRLPDTELANLETWVKSGAFDPRVNLPNQAPKRNWADVVAERRKWWSLQPVRPTPAPPEASSEWSAPVDRFVYQRLRSDDLTPSPLASPGALLRRVTIVLTGLPPTPDEIASFEAAARENRTAAYADLVDRLLASPRYGERFARHWLDVVRFTETHGNEWNYDVPYAWPRVGIADRKRVLSLWRSESRQLRKISDHRLRHRRQPVGHAHQDVSSDYGRLRPLPRS
jgi:hypothetical protein